MAASSLKSVKPEELAKLKVIDLKAQGIEFKYSNHQIRSSKNEQQREEQKNKNKNGNRKRENGCDKLGTSEYKFFKGSEAAEAKKYALKYIPHDSSEPSKEMPGFFQTPPGIVLTHTIVGIGLKTPKDDVPLNRKFSIITIHGLYKRDENGNLTDEIDTRGVFSQYHHDYWYAKNPFKRDVEEKRTLSYEINNFFRLIDSLKDQTADFLLNGTEIIRECPKRLERIVDKATKFGAEWISKVRKMRREGNKDIPKLEVDEWEKTPEYIEHVFPNAQISAIKSIMSDPTAYDVKIERFRTVLINSFYTDLKRTSMARANKDARTDEQKIELATKMADEFIEANPDWNERLAIVKYERKVWQPSESCKDDMKKQETVRKAVSEKYDQILQQVKQQNPSLKDYQLQRKADVILAEYITDVHQWKFNIPEIYDSSGDQIRNPLNCKPHHKYTKPHYALNPGSLIALNFLVNLSVPTSAETAYGLKLNFYGHVMCTTPAMYIPDQTYQVNTYDFGDDISEYSQIAEYIKHKNEEKKLKKMGGDEGQKPASSSKQKYNINGNEPLKCDFNDAALHNYMKQEASSSNDFKTDSDNEEESDHEEVTTNHDELDDDEEKNKKHTSKRVERDFDDSTPSTTTKVTKKFNRR